MAIQRGGFCRGISVLLTTVAIGLVWANPVHADPAWSIGARDSTPGGWLVTLTYLVGVYFCCKAYASRVKRKGDLLPLSMSETPAFWLFCCAVLLFLGLNKQLDLQTLLLQIWRPKGIEDHLGVNRYAEARSFAILYLAGVVFVVVTTAMVAKKYSSELRTTLAGLGLILIYIVFRAGTFNGNPGVLEDKPVLSILLLLTEPIGIFMVIRSAYRFNQKSGTIIECRHDKI